MKMKQEYRFLVTSDLSWRHEDIIRTFTLRWLIEVFIEDWKQHEGWNRMVELNCLICYLKLLIYG